MAPLATAISGDVTRWLLCWSQGDEAALDQLFPLVYDELRRLAAARLRRERKDHTLEPLSLVHEAYLRLVDQQRTEWANREQFFAVSARIMRRVLIDHARRHVSSKRGGAAQRLAIENMDQLPAHRSSDWLDLDDALHRLADWDPEQSRIVEMHFFGGLTHEEISSALGLSVPTVIRRWRLARARLYRYLSGNHAEPRTEE